MVFKAGKEVMEVVKNKPFNLNGWQRLTIRFTSNDYPDAKFSISIGILEILFDDIALMETK